MAKMKKLPGVLSFQRGIIVGDGLMYSLMADGREVPLHVMRHGIRGTQNVNNEKEGSEASTTANAKGRKVANVQQTNSAKLHPDSDKLVVRFDLRTIDVQSALFSCAPGQGDDMSEIQEFKAQLRTFLDSTKAGAMQALCLRYVRNLTNGRFLWRNRTIAQRVLIEIKGAGSVARFDALTRPLNNFDGIIAEETALANELADGFLGNRDTKLSVRAVVEFGVRGLEVYPSQNYLTIKEKGFARSLYHVGEVLGGIETEGNTFLGHAAIRDQKLGNAIRSVDTWYDRYLELGVAIPVEPNGANLETQLFLRGRKDSGFEYMRDVANIKPDDQAGLFLLACIIRGGVYSGSEAS